MFAVYCEKPHSDDPNPCALRTEANAKPRRLMNEKA
jgi:hypothetical protein